MAVVGVSQRRWTSDGPAPSETTPCPDDSEASQPVASPLAIGSPLAGADRISARPLTPAVLPRIRDARPAGPPPPPAFEPPRVERRVSSRGALVHARPTRPRRHGPRRTHPRPGRRTSRAWPSLECFARAPPGTRTRNPRIGALPLPLLRPVGVSVRSVPPRGLGIVDCSRRAGRQPVVVPAGHTPAAGAFVDRGCPAIGRRIAHATGTKRPRDQR